MRPVLCMITDRRRFGDAWERLLLERVEAAARAGVHIIQVRERDLEARALVHLVEACLRRVRHTAARVVVNDRVDVALAAGAHGVHLRGDSMPALRVRNAAPALRLVGRSVQSEREACAAERAGGLDYLIAGTVYETGSKPGRLPCGIDTFSSIAASTALPVLAVGGVTRARVDEIMAARGAGVAGISLFAEV